MNFSARLAAGWRSGPLSDRSFRLLASGQFTSTVGDYCYAVALPWLVLSAHGGTILLGTVLACYGLPRAAAIPVGGLLTDKIGPRAIMLTADATRCGLVIVLVALAARHVAALALLGPVAALLGAGEGLFIPASFSIMPSLLEPGQLAAGNAVNSAAVQAGSVAGPVLGGLLVATAGPAPAFAVDAASFAVSALSLALIRPRPSAAAAGAPAGPADGATGQGQPRGTGNVVFLTMIQRWAPPRLLGRVMSVIMLAGIGSFPLSVAVSGVLVHHLGPSPFFPVAAATVAISIFGAMSQREFRDFGSAQPPEAELGAESA